MTDTRIIDENVATLFLSENMMPKCLTGGFGRDIYLNKLFHDLL
jgi:hypothetical protein